MLQRKLKNYSKEWVEMGRAEGRVAIITGSTYGIGKAIVRILEEQLNAKHLQAKSMSRITCMIFQKMVNSYG